MFWCCFKPKVGVLHEAECQADVRPLMRNTGCGTELIETRDAVTQVDDKMMVIDHLDEQIKRLQAMRQSVRAEHQFDTKYNFTKPFRVYEHQV